MFLVEVVDKISKGGNPYRVLEITFPCGYKKIVFLDKSEEYLADM